MDRVEFIGQGQFFFFHKKNVREVKFFSDLNRFLLIDRLFLLFYEI